jgi:hypothetical protein
MEQEHLEMALEKMDMTTFDVFHFETIFNDNSLQFMAYKIFQQHQLFNFARIKLENFVCFVREIAQGYFKENQYHNQQHIIDSL